jgi:hypothetical protein
MVWLLVLDRILTPRIKLPRRDLDIAFDVGVMGLLLGLYELDKSFGDYLAGGLVHVLEAGKVESLDLSLVTNGPLWDLLDRQWCSVTVSISSPVYQGARLFALSACNRVVPVGAVERRFHLEFAWASPTG